MPVSWSDVRKQLMFTDTPKPLTFWRLDEQPGDEPVPIKVHMCNASLPLHRLLPATQLWTYEGLYPGPAIVVRKGQRVSVEWVNELSPPYPSRVVTCAQQDPGTKCVPPPLPPSTDPNALVRHAMNFPGTSAGTVDTLSESIPPWTVVHQHGGLTPADGDGWTDNAFLPRSETEGSNDSQRLSQWSHYRNDQPATLLWYHDHAMAITRLNVYAGLAAPWVIRDDEEAALNLPSGDDELFLVIQDRNLDLDADGCTLLGELVHKVETDDVDPGNRTMEFFGPFNVVNGTIWPCITVRPRLTRVRLLNGSNARTYALWLYEGDTNADPDAVKKPPLKAFTVIGTDGGLRDAPSDPLDVIKLAPAERIDLLIDFSGYPDGHLTLYNTANAPFDDDPNKQIVPTIDGQSKEDFRLTEMVKFSEVLRFDVRNETSVPGKAPATLSKSFRRWQDETDPDLQDPGAEGGMTRRRYLGLHEQQGQKGSMEQPSDFLYFNEYMEIEAKYAEVTLNDPESSRPGPVNLKNNPVLFYDTINYELDAGYPEIWTILNFSTDTHPVHLHLVQFQVLRRVSITLPPGVAPGNNGLICPGNDKKPVTVTLGTKPTPTDPLDVGWKDTVRVNPNEAVVIAALFKGFTGRYMYHCHILEHEDHDMMRPFVVRPRVVSQIMMSGMMTMGVMTGGQIRCPNGSMPMGGMSRRMRRMR